jgi:hypothetical protein
MRCCWKQVLTIVLAGNPGLVGPAFPSAWLQPEALPALTWFDITGSAGLVGTLPASLQWPNIKTL